MLDKAKKVSSLTISAWSVSDLELIGIGGFSPLTGFMNQTDYLSVLNDLRLSNGLIWSIPITLPVTKEEADQMMIGQNVSLKGEDGIIYGMLQLEEKYTYDKKKEAKMIYGTTDQDHPGVRK